MISMDVRHPDILDFVKIKRDLTQVTGANISVKLNDEFMTAVKEDGIYCLSYPVDAEYNLKAEWKLNQTYKHEGNTYKWVKAKEYWDEIIKSAHGVAEPGLMFWDNMVNYSPDGIYPQYKQVTTNPCSEIAMQPYDACRLIAVNLFSFVDNPFTKDATFNYDRFYEVNYTAMDLSDLLIDLELEKIDKILAKIEEDGEPDSVKAIEHELWTNIRNTAANSRRTGLGFTGLGDTLAALGYRYDDPASLSIVETIMSWKMKSELDCTIDLAILYGTFEGFDANKEFYWANNSETREGRNEFYQMLNKTFTAETSRMCKYGRRNVSWSTVAPTGTVSIMTQTTSGIEPLFQPYYIRRKKVNPNEESVKVDFVDQNGDSWEEYPVVHPKFREWMYTTHAIGSKSLSTITESTLQELFEQSPWYGSTANDIDWSNRVKMQAIIQKYITHSISSTINLPNDVSEESVSEIYLDSWKEGLKGITVYRDGARSGVLITKSETKSDSFTYTDAPKRPKVLNCDIHTTTFRGTEFLVVVGLYDGNPYEVLALENEHGIKPSEGQLIKVRKGQYDLTVEGEVVLENLTSHITHEEEAITRMLSFGLRHGGDITFAVEQLRKSEGDITAFSKSIARVLNKYTKPRDLKEECPECSAELVREEGCLSCKSCGFSKCG